MANGEIYITVSNKSQNVGVGVAGGNNKIGITGDNSQYFSNEARKSAEQAKQSATEAQNFADQAENSKNELLNDTGFVAVKDNLDSIITTAVNIEDINTNAENIEAIKNASTIALGKADRDLSNLSEQGQAKFDAKADKSELNNKANKDLNNVVEIAEGSLVDNELKNKLNNQQITNCLLEVPQKIKLELNDGVLTLKAGSKVIVPNGFEADGTTPKFDEIVVTKDLSVGASSLSTAERGIVLINGGITLIHWASNKSGTSPTTQGFYYHTGENKFYRDGVAQTNFSFPIMMGDYTTQYGFNNIKHVFNGMGYFGSTIWVDKGVKLLFPNGRNEDGTLNNIEFTTDKILMQTQPNATANIDLYLSKTGVFLSTVTYYDEKLNLNISSDGGVNMGAVLIGNCTLTNGVISNFQPKLPFRAVDYNDKSEISSWGMPSDKYIDLTLGASGTTYTAPANGWFNFIAVSSTTVSSIGIANTTSGLNSFVPCSIKQTSLQLYVPAKKGDVCEVVYSNIDNNYTDFKFIYAEGDK